MAKDKKRIATIAGLSVILYLIVMFTRYTKSIYIGTGCYTVAYFAFTLSALHYYRKRYELSVKAIAAAILFGSIILEIPVRILDFDGTLFSLAGTVIVCLAIILAVLSYAEKRVSVYVLSVVVLFFLNIYLQRTWFDIIGGYLGSAYRDPIFMQ